MQNNCHLNVYCSSLVMISSCLLLKSSFFCKNNSLADLLSPIFTVFCLCFSIFCADICWNHVVLADVFKILIQPSFRTNTVYKFSIWLLGFYLLTCDVHGRASWVFGDSWVDALYSCSFKDICVCHIVLSFDSFDLTHIFSFGICLASFLCVPKVPMICCHREEYSAHMRWRQSSFSWLWALPHALLDILISCASFYRCVCLIRSPGIGLRRYVKSCTTARNL